jgi:Fe-S-cluster containining protein
MVKLTKREESDICLSCGECCKRYYITLLKDEIIPIAKNLRISQKKFLAEYCELHVKIFPKSTPGILTFPTIFFPQSVGELIKNNLGHSPQGFFVLPQIALKREGGICPFLPKDLACEIYKARPEPCKLFPYIAVPGYRENYPFCPLFRKQWKDYSKKSRSYFKKVKNYFHEIEEKGFKKFWKNPSTTGKIFLNETLMGKITLNELEQMMVNKKIN